MRCPRCQTEYTADMAFCAVCGKRLSIEEQTQASSEPALETNEPAITQPDRPRAPGARITTELPPLDEEVLAPPAETPPIAPVAPPAQIGTPPITMAPRSSGLARAAAWVGGISAGLMLLADALALIGLLADSQIAAGLGFLAAAPALLSAPVGFGMGLFALFGQRSSGQPQSNRDALIGIGAGVVCLLLCCGLGVIATAYGVNVSE